jgi:phage gpG-like protein
MSNAVTLSQLQKLAKSLSATPEKLARGLAKASTEIRKLVADEFATGTNPWGRAWPKPADGGAPLQRTGALANSVSVVSSGDKITTKVGAAYGKYLQGGRKRAKRGPLRPGEKRKASVVMRPRAIVPFKKLPPTWQLALVQALVGELEGGLT